MGTRTRTEQGYGNGVNKLLRTDLRRAMALIIYRNPSNHNPHEQTPHTNKYTNTPDLVL